ncbi:tripartite tricarboxylate transporter substrate-binding protein [Bradyrhizobium paxllaeri]|uniref:tripartite tricarboxylate transporter substrate-binding protein n=1 Tax=Bradyrhizobium paxllaeri TaxID=190148 RepID=UPI000810A6B3
MVVGPAIGAPASYETLADFQPVGMLGTSPLLLVVNAESPHKTLKDLVAWSKANPSTANYASASPTFTLAAELLKLRSGAGSCPTCRPWPKLVSQALKRLSGQVSSCPRARRQKL